MSAQSKAITSKPFPLADLNSRAFATVAVVVPIGIVIGAVTTKFAPVGDPIGVFAILQVRSLGSGLAARSLMPMAT